MMVKYNCLFLPYFKPNKFILAEFENKLLDLLQSEGNKDRENLTENLKYLGDTFEKCISKLMES